MPDYRNLCGETIRKGNAATQMALSKCRLALYSSEWAADTALKNYEVDAQKVQVVPFGANIACTRTFDDIRRIVENKDLDTCRLLFVGTNWSNKGGDFAISVADQLNRRGIKTEQHIVGCDPKVEMPAFVKQHGFISKRTEEGRMFIDQLMTESHFLILPSRAECYGIVFAEASSFGLPSLATRVGGIQTAVRDGKNGQTFPLNAGPDKYCEYIERFMASREDYKELALASFREYSERLNWDSAGEKVRNLIHQHCS